MHQISTLKRFSYCLGAVFAKTRCKVENEDVVGAAPTGDAPTTSEWSTIFFPTKVCLILEVLRYIEIMQNSGKSCNESTRKSLAFSTLKTKSLHDANFVITGGMDSCHDNDIWCHQWMTRLVSWQLAVFSKFFSCLHLSSGYKSLGTYYCWNEYDWREILALLVHLLTTDVLVCSCRMFLLRTRTVAE